jgi:hypothetical protein
LALVGVRLLAEVTPTIPELDGIVNVEDDRVRHAGVQGVVVGIGERHGDSGAGCTTMGGSDDLPHGLVVNRVRQRHAAIPQARHRVHGQRH